MKYLNRILTLAQGLCLFGTLISGTVAFAGDNTFETVKADLWRSGLALDSFEQAPRFIEEMEWKTKGHEVYEELERPLLRVIKQSQISM